MCAYLILLFFAAKMLMPTKNRHMIYEYLFKEGVLVAKKDFQAPKHPEIDVPNLQVIKTLQVEYVIQNVASQRTFVW